ETCRMIEFPGARKPWVVVNPHLGRQTPNPAPSNEGPNPFHDPPSPHAAKPAPHRSKRLCPRPVPQVPKPPCSQGVAQPQPFRTWSTGARLPCGPSCQHQHQTKSSLPSLAFLTLHLTDKYNDLFHYAIAMCLYTCHGYNGPHSKMEGQKGCQWKGHNCKIAQHSSRLKTSISGSLSPSA
uniref:Uncharacterized protein n=1 Tax=Gopherus evgoodei TaxID=1825980 RepID=A0A8C4WAR1_9SAUR